MCVFKNEIEYLGHLVSGQGISSMRQKIKAITDLVPTTNITEARHMIGLIGCCRKFFPIFSDMSRLLSELTKKNIPFKWTKKCQKSLDLVKQVITTNPFLIYPDLDKQYCLFMNSSKHSWSGIFIQYTKQIKEDGTKLKLPHPITHQWYFSRIPKELEYFNQRALCHLHVLP